jgi:hypothetical protein
MTIDIETKLLEAFSADTRARQRLAKLQEESAALAQEITKRSGGIDAWMEIYEDQKGEPFREAVKRPELAERFNRMLAGETNGAAVAKADSKPLQLLQPQPQPQPELAAAQ